MFLHVEISTDPVVPGRNGIGKNNQPYSIPAKQNAALHYGGAFPFPFQVAVHPTNGPYKPGRYVLAGDIVRPGEYGPQINLRDAILEPFEEAAKQMTGDLAKLKAA